MARFDAYHGTSAKNANNIRSEGFFPSVSNIEWLGNGVYFFLNGISNPEDDAECWAICNSWDNKNKVRTYDQYAVLYSTLNVDDDSILDLDDDDSDKRKFFTEFREVFFEKIRKAGKYYGNVADGFIINELIENRILPVKMVKSKMYVQLKELDRKFRIISRIPNCTICSVNDLNCISNVCIKYVRFINDA